MKKIIINAILLIGFFTAFRMTETCYAQIDPPSGYTVHYSFRMWDEGDYPSADSVNQNMIDIDNAVYNRKISIDSLRTAFLVSHHSTGYLKQGMVSTAVLQDYCVSENKINDNALTNQLVNKAISSGIYRLGLNFDAQQFKDTVLRLANPTNIQYTADYTIGTVDAYSFKIKTDNAVRLLINNLGSVTLGTNSGTGIGQLYAGYGKFTDSLSAGHTFYIKGNYGDLKFIEDSDGNWSINPTAGTSVWFGNADLGQYRDVYANHFYANQYYGMDSTELVSYSGSLAAGSLYLSTSGSGETNRQLYKIPISINGVTYNVLVSDEP